MAVKGRDEEAALNENPRLSQEQIARAYRVPPWIIGTNYPKPSWWRSPRPLAVPSDHLEVPSVSAVRDITVRKA